MAETLGPPAHLTPDQPASRILAAVTAGGTARAGGAAVLVLRRVDDTVT